MIRSSKRLMFALLASSSLLLAGCGVFSDSADAEATSGPATATIAATSETTASASATATVSVEVDDLARSDVDRVLGHIDELALTIGVRDAGSEGELAAARYIEGELIAAGYATAIEPFTASTRTDTSVALTAGRVSVRPFMMRGSASGEVIGRLVYGGLGSSSDLAGLELEGAVLLLDRGVLPFGEKAANAEAAGAVALLIANNEEGAYSGSLGDGVTSEIPVVAIRRAEGDILRPLAERGVDLTVRAQIETIEVESQNVVGRAGERCEVYVGAHYDSVPVGPGANDNASGTALLIELARVHRTDGLCVVAFGAEEIGLFGSQAFVEAHDVSDGRLMLNFDMVGRLDGPSIIGNSLLTRDLLDALAAAGEFPIRAGSFPPFASSDHVSFSDAGVAAVTITSGDDPAIHTSDDEVGRILPEDLAVMLVIADVLLSSVVGS